MYDNNVTKTTLCRKCWEADETSLDVRYVYSSYWNGEQDGIVRRISVSYTSLGIDGVSGIKQYAVCTIKPTLSEWKLPEPL